MKNSKRHFCYEKNRITKDFQNNTNFEYLGFQFDGYYTLLKNASLSSYYRKMKRSIGRGHFYSMHNRTRTKGELFKNRLYKRFTHMGSNRRRIYKRHPHFTDRFFISYKYDWGNYLTYAKLAAKTISNNKITSQLKNHWKIFHNLISSLPTDN